MIYILHPVRFIDSGRFSSGAWLPIIILTLLLTGLHYVMLPELLANYDDPAFVTQFAERNQMTEIAAADEINKMKTVAPYMGFVEAPMIIAAGIAGVAGLLYLIGRFRFKRKAPYPSLFSLVAWGSLISAVPLSLNLIARIINPDLELPTNAAALLPNSLENSFFYNVLLAVDPFLIWQVWLMGLGLASLYEVSRQRAIESVGTMFVILTVINAMTMTAAVK